MEVQKQSEQSFKRGDSVLFDDEDIHIVIGWSHAGRAYADSLLSAECDGCHDLHTVDLATGVPWIHSWDNAGMRRRMRNSMRHIDAKVTC